MTFIPSINSVVSDLNSTTSTLTAGQTFTGVAQIVAAYNSIDVVAKTDVASAACGLNVQFSQDGTNWDIINSYTYDAKESYYQVNVRIASKYFRIVYINGGSNQSIFRLQSHLNLASSNEVKLEPYLIDTFGRVRMSPPHTVLSVSHLTGKNPYTVYEAIVSAATSVYNANASCVDMNTTGTGSVIRRTRMRGIYQPGKSLLVYMTGILNLNNNASTVTTKIGYYDNSSGYYFQHNNGITSVVERTSVTGTLVETVVNQSSWNVNQLSNYTTLDVTKTLIFWLSFEWLGVGLVSMGIIINGKSILLHNFRHSNINTDVYIQTASLPITYEIISTGGAGGVKQICGTVISEGGYNPIGKNFSANGLRVGRGIQLAVLPIMSIRLKTTSKVMCLVNKISICCTTATYALVQVYKFVDTATTSVLTAGSAFTQRTDSDVEFDNSATAVTLTNGILIDSTYFTTNNDTVIIGGGENSFISVSNGVSDLYVVTGVCIIAAAAAETFFGSISWSEII